MDLIICEKDIQQVSAEIEKCMCELEWVQIRAKYQLNRISKDEYKGNAILSLQSTVRKIRTQIELLLKRKADLLDLKLKLVRKIAFKPFDWVTEMDPQIQSLRRHNCEKK